MRKLIELTTSVVGRLRHLLGSYIPIQGSLVKINLGCGLAVYSGWINIDGSLNTFVASLPKVFQRLAYRVSGANSYYSFKDYQIILSSNLFFHADLSYGIPIGDCTVDFIYSSHFLEHLYPCDARRLLIECFRILKPNGTIRVCVPDLEHAFDMYNKGLKRECLDKYFFVEKKGSSYAKHKYMYDFELLAALIRGCGFNSIRRCEFREGDVPDIRYLDNRPDDTLFVEAKKLISI